MATLCYLLECIVIIRLPYRDQHPWPNHYFFRFNQNVAMQLVAPSRTITSKPPSWVWWCCLDELSCSFLPFQAYSSSSSIRYMVTDELLQMTLPWYISSYASDVMCIHRWYFMPDLYFNWCAMISCVGFLLRSGVMVSYPVMKIINIGFDLITLLNINNFIILSHYTGGGIIFLR